MTHAQTHIDTQFNNKAIETKIEVEEVFINEVVNGKTIIADKLTGELEIKDYPVLTEIRLKEHEIEKLVIINCPNLEKINCHGNKLTKLDITRIKTDADGNPVSTDKLKVLYIGVNKELEEVSLEYCPKLEHFCVPGNKKLDKVLGLSKLSKLRFISGIDLPRGLVDLIAAETESTTTFYEKQINTLREEKDQLVEETGSHLESLEISEVWNKRQKQELLDEIKKFKEENKRLKEKNKKIIPEELANKIESYEKEISELKKQLEQTNNQLAQIEVTPKENKIKDF